MTPLNVYLLMALLPVVFMIHEFEEIIMFKPWLKKNAEALSRRFPKAKNILLRNHEELSTQGFTVAVLHEFLIISFCTITSLLTYRHGLWFGAFMAYFLHLFVHIVQWMLYGKYIPVIITSFLTLPYCVYTLVEFLTVTNLTNAQLIIWTAIGLVIAALSFTSAFYFAHLFERWKNRVYLK